MSPAASSTLPVGASTLPAAPGPAPTNPPAASVPADVARVLKRFWGYDTLRPLQAEAIAAGVSKRDSLVVLPTGGGKSICYQIPPMVTQRTDIVVSPLIALMKDQVDGLRENGYPAVALHSGQGAAANREFAHDVVSGKYRLIFVAPERLLNPGFLDICDRLQIGSFAIDEAHCISQWGHDFRPEYRRLALLRERYPSVSLHAYTATATPRVREDIVAQLRLRNPSILVGNFDRPNLVYRVIPKIDLDRQVLETIRRHQGEAVIVYCISRKDTEGLAAWLRQVGVRAAHYHAGMAPEDRRNTQDAFQNEQLDVIVATVAFGMGIDRGDVRCVIHASMPKSVEHYQQETGRAGRDGLAAECVLFFSGGDPIRWAELLAWSTAKAELPAEVMRAQLELLRHMQAYCEAPWCRHAALVEYFGQRLGGENCGACDVCLGEIEPAEDATELVRKILSGVARVQQRFGMGHVCEMLLGSNTKMIRTCGHDQLSTFGLLRGMDIGVLKNVMHLLVERAYLDRTPGDRPIIKLTQAGLRAMRGEERVMLRMPRERTVDAAPIARDEWEGVDRGLFDALRAVRRELAEERGVPPFVILHDTVLRDLARIRPSSTKKLMAMKGLGARKVQEFGEKLIATVAAYARDHKLTLDVGAAASAPVPEALPARLAGARPNPQKAQALAMLEQGRPLQEIASATGRALSTIGGYLCDMVLTNPDLPLAPWVDEATHARVTAALSEVEEPGLKAVFGHLGELVSYEQIRLVITQWRARESKESAEQPRA